MWVVATAGLLRAYVFYYHSKFMVYGCRWTEDPKGCGINLAHRHSCMERAKIFVDDGNKNVWHPVIPIGLSARCFFLMVAELGWMRILCAFGCHMVCVLCNRRSTLLAFVIWFNYFIHSLNL